MRNKEVTVVKCSASFLDASQPSLWMRGFDPVATHFWFCGPWKPVLFRIPAEVSTCDGEEGSKVQPVAQEAHGAVLVSTSSSVLQWQVTRSQLW